jgi:hypothetical protein
MQTDTQPHTFARKDSRTPHGDSQDFTLRAGFGAGAKAEKAETENSARVTRVNALNLASARAIA